MTSKNPEIVYWFIKDAKEIPLMLEDGKITKEEVKEALDYIRENQIVSEEEFKEKAFQIKLGAEFIKTYNILQSQGKANEFEETIKQFQKDLSNKLKREE